MLFIATAYDLTIMNRAIENNHQSLPNVEVTPLVNFLVNATTDATELELLRKNFNETVSP